VRIAARFRIPVRTAGELLRLAYFEDLRRQGLSHADIAERLGQTERNMRMLERKLKGEFFMAETDVGLVREVEDVIAAHRPTEHALVDRMSSWEPESVAHALGVLLDEGRVERSGKRLVPAHRYVQLTSSAFHQRIDALNHFLDGVTRAVVQRLVFDETKNAMIKTISFDAHPKAFQRFRNEFEEKLRQDVAELEQTADRAGAVRYVLGVNAGTRDD